MIIAAPATAAGIRPVSRLLVAAVTAALLSGCALLETAVDPAPRAVDTIPAPTRPTPADTGTPDGPDAAERADASLPTNPALWGTGRAGSVRVPTPMRSLAVEESGPVTAAVFHAGGRVRPRLLADWVMSANSDLTWELARLRDGYTVKGAAADRSTRVVVDVVTVETGVLVRVVDPGTDPTPPVSPEPEPGTSTSDGVSGEAEGDAEAAFANPFDDGPDHP